MTTDQNMEDVDIMPLGSPEYKEYLRKKFDWPDGDTDITTARKIRNAAGEVISFELIKVVGYRDGNVVDVRYYGSSTHD